MYISTERVADNAQTEGVSFGHELCRVMVHGLLHLAGYGDKTPEQEALMRQKEDFYLARLPFSI
jgi:rRNA maturation RNase YbeY